MVNLLLGVSVAESTVKVRAFGVNSRLSETSFPDIASFIVRAFFIESKALSLWVVTMN